MKRIVVCALIVLFSLMTANTEAQKLPSLDVAPFGTVRVYKTQQHPSRVVILMSGEEGWDRTAEELAAQMTSLDCLVIGVDAGGYLGRLIAGKTCTYPAADFENLSRFVQQKLELTQYTRPILAGYSLGSALVYATLVQSPVDIFAGGISIGFCPDAPLTQGVCRGLGVDWSGEGHRLLPASELRTPWIVLPQSTGKGCSSVADAFLKQVGGVQILTSPQKEESEDNADTSNDLLLQALKALSGKEQKQLPSAAEALTGLPLVVVPAEKSNAGSQPNLMAVFLSGDGGWAGLDHDVGDAIAKHGIPLVGLSSLRYFWTPRTPEGTARDVALILRHYLDVWKKEKAILIGYSFGADVLPFVVNRLPDDLKLRIDRVVLIGPSPSAQFQFHLSNWFEGASENSVPTLPEVQRMKGFKILCAYGEEENESLCPSLDPSLAVRILLPGGHHFDGNYPALAEKILEPESPAPTGH